MRREKAARRGGGEGGLTVNDEYMLLLERSRDLLLAGLKFHPGVFEGESLRLGKFPLSRAIVGYGTWPGALPRENPHAPPPTRAPAAIRSSDGALGRPARALAAR